jgi:hypothetical protein
MVAPEQKLRDGLIKKGVDGGLVSKAKKERFIYFIHIEGKIHFNLSLKRSKHESVEA